MLHGLLHLCGHDHELGEQESETMAEEERNILQALGWKVSLCCVRCNCAQSFWDLLL